MYLKRLDLQGFKSFPDKVKLEFNKGITAVVGPNGSGKSNISDSVRWVLGEQRVKSLRGDKMEDVIFAGTDDRRALGFAEVSLTLDNEDRKMPLDFSEITVTRTVYRSGESRYAINKTPCRLKDIHELFMDTGVGREGYSIIGQGRIDEILSSKSEDRRRLFEEAAGIVKYRSRRSEAIDKLEKEQQNLCRVEDIINELELKIEPLKEETEKAKKYLDLKEQLKIYEVNDFCVSIRRIDENAEKTEESIEISKANIADEENEYEKLKEKSESLKSDDGALSEKIQQLNNEKARLSSMAERTDGEIKLAKEQIGNYINTISRLERETAAKEETEKQLETEISKLEEKERSLEEETAGLNSEIEEKSQKLEEISGAINSRQEMSDNYKSEVIEKIRLTTEINTDIKRTELTIQQLEEKAENLETQKAGYEGKILVLQKMAQSCSEKISALTKEKEKLKNDESFLEEKKNGLIAKADDINFKIKKNTSTLNEHRSRIKVLSDMKNEFEGYYGSVKNILKQREKGTLNGICGAVAELIETDKKYEAAIEVAVGGVMQNIVVETEADGKKAIEFLKRNNMGRASFMPIDVIKGRDLGAEKGTVLSQKGVCGIADELVRYNSRYYDVVKSILGRVIVVDNMDNAIALAGKTGHKYKIVTLAGDVLNAGGTMTGGSFNKKTGGIFGRNREITDLQEEEKKLSETNKVLAQNQEELDEEILDCSDELREISISMQKIDLEIISVQREAEGNQKDLEEAQERVDVSSEGAESAKAEKEKALKDIADFKAKLEKTEKEIDDINSQMENFQSTLQTGKEEREKLLEVITEKKVLLSALMETKNSADSALKRAVADKKSCAEDITVFKIETEENKNFKTEKENALLQCQLSIKQTEEMLKEVEEDFETTSAQKADFSEEFDRCINEQQSLFETISKLKNDLYKLEARRDKLEEDRNSIFARIWEEYEITLEEAKKLYDENIDVSEISRKIREFKNDIKLLGNVNVNAIEEYKQVRERYDFLTTQRDDIKEAEDNLLKVIDELAVMMETQFKEQFEVISQNFNKVFREMFGGGQGYLRLADENDILESGIEIIAQPPGKRLQNMMLLSGGERALTAIAILFAILKMKPSPFCILDEIEAALDDANVKRYADYLKSFSGGTQFIVITHRKGTMEAADVMYGVTMQERGISKVISVKFEEAAESIM